jgi:hypothetical protein
VEIHDVSELKDFKLATPHVLDDSESSIDDYVKEERLFYKSIKKLPADVQDFKTKERWRALEQRYKEKYTYENKDNQILIKAVILIINKPFEHHKWIDAIKELGQVLIVILENYPPKKYPHQTSKKLLNLYPNALPFEFERKIYSEFFNIGRDIVYKGIYCINTKICSDIYEYLNLYSDEHLIPHVIHERNIPSYRTKKISMMKNRRRIFYKIDN